MRKLVAGNGSVLSQLEPLQERSAHAVCPPSSTKTGHTERISDRMQQNSSREPISHRGDYTCHRHGMALHSAPSSQVPPGITLRP